MSKLYNNELTESKELWYGEKSYYYELYASARIILLPLGNDKWLVRGINDNSSRDLFRDIEVDSFTEARVVLDTIIHLKTHIKFY